MKISLGQIENEQSIPLKHGYNAEEHELNFHDQTFADPIKFDAIAKKEHDCLFVDGELKAVLKRQCSRCLKWVEEDFQEKVHLVLNVHDLFEVDITEDLREIVLFDHPMKFVCRESCLGICPSCGANRNDSPDCCKTSFRKEGSFDALKKFNK